MDIIQEIQNKIFSLKDEKYKEFTSKLIPTVNTERIIGIQMPKLRSLSKGLRKNESINKFLLHLPHKYHEENLLHACILEQIEEFETCIKYVNLFLPYVDNWAVCDTMKPKSFVKNKNELLKHIKIWLNSKNTYSVRYAILMLMTHFLDSDFNTSYLTLVASVKTNEYYVTMMIAWYFATALSKQYKDAIKVLEENRLNIWIHNKTIQKSLESFRITTEQKQYLKTLKR